MKKKDWRYRKVTEAKYKAALKKAADLITTVAQKHTNIQEMLEAIKAIGQQDWYKGYAQAVAFNMVKASVTQNARTWREAAAQGGRSRQIYEALQNQVGNNPKFLEIVERNANWIKSLPDNVAREVSQKAGEYAVSGVRSSELVKEIQKQVPHIAKWKAELIARTEVSKSQAAITEIRAKDIGIQWYEWETSQDSRVRSSHDIMQGVLCQYDDPPSPEMLDKKRTQGQYGPGQTFNCRCYSAPLTEVDDVQWPHKVYFNGRIQKMTRGQFLKIAGIQKTA